MSTADPDGEDRSVLERPAPAPQAQWRYGPDPQHVADVYLPVAPTVGAVVLVHGGFWRPEYDRMHLRPLAHALAESGHPVTSLEYRRVPGDPDVTVADLMLALDALRDRPPADWPSGATTIVGHSAGGHLSLMLAATPHPITGAVVALAPVADLVMAERLSLDGDAARAFLGGPAADRPDLDPIHRAPACPVALLHGEGDAVVPLALSQSFADAHPDARLTSLAGVGHFALIDPQSGAFVELLSALATAGIE